MTRLLVRVPVGAKKIRLLQRIQSFFRNLPLSEMGELKKTKSCHTVEDVSEKDFERISKDFPMYDGIIRLSPGRWFLLSNCPKILDKIYDFDFRPTDTIVMTYPKSGTTWMQEIVWTLRHNPNLDNEEANALLDLRSPHLEVDSILLSKKVPRFDADHDLIKFLRKVAPDRVDDEEKILAFLEHLPNPRVIKSHLSLDLFPPTMLQKSKVIYMARDPRDVIISKYHFFSVVLPHSYSGTLDHFIDYMINEEQLNHPYWPHIKLAYDLRDHPNLLFLYFEDLLSNPRKTIADISEFLGLNRTEEQIQNVVDFTNFKNMKKRTDEGEAGEPMSDGGRFRKEATGNEEGASFYRKGKSGDWKDSFSEEQVGKIILWMEKNLKEFPKDFKYKT